VRVIAEPPDQRFALIRCQRSIARKEGLDDPGAHDPVRIARELLCRSEAPDRAGSCGVRPRARIGRSSRRRTRLFNEVHLQQRILRPPRDKARQNGALGRFGTRPCEQHRSHVVWMEVQQTVHRAPSHQRIRIFEPELEPGSERGVVDASLRTQLPHLLGAGDRSGLLANWRRKQDLRVP